MKAAYALSLVGAALLLASIAATAALLIPDAHAPTEIEQTYKQLPTATAKNLYFAQSEQLTKPVPDRLVALDTKRIGCFGTRTIHGMDPDGENLGGQCCGVLHSIDAYDEQLEALHTFLEDHGEPGFIPEDPYDIPVAHAQRLIRFDEQITLDAQQRAVYDDAVEQSHHGGPCCCKCWRWNMMSGAAKKLIVEHDWSARDIAQLWDLSSSCGHEEDTDFSQHYDGEDEH